MDFLFLYDIMKLKRYAEIFDIGEICMKKKLAALLAICMLSVTMTACGGGNAPAETTTAEKTANAEPDTNNTTGDSNGFTLLDVTADMIKVGIHAIDEDNTELVFSMFTAPSGTPMASMFVFETDGSGDVICGPYTSDTYTDENGINWSLLTVSDVYRELTFEIGFAETDDGQVCIMNSAGSVYEGQYLTADGTIAYMGTAAALIS